MMSNLPRKTRILGLALLIVTFGVGASTGAAFDRILASGTPVIAPVAEEQPRPEPSTIHEGSIFDHLDLTPEQRESVDAILARRKAEMDAFWEEAGPRMRSLVRSANAEIRALLTPEQLEEYGRIRAERRRAERERCQQDHNAKENQSR